MPSSVLEVGGGAARGVARRGQVAGSRAKLLGVSLSCQPLEKTARSLFVVGWKGGTSIGEIVSRARKDTHNSVRRYSKSLLKRLSDTGGGAESRCCDDTPEKDGSAEG